MYIFLHTALILYTVAAEIPDNVKDNPLIKDDPRVNVTVYEISNGLVNLLGINLENKRVQELKTKLDKISNYVVDNNLVAAILTNVSSETTLNETNFYEALNENDHFQYLSGNSSKNLYLKLKEKMTRDDILKIVAEKGKGKKLKKSARRMMSNKLPKKDDDDIMNDVVDKMIGEVPVDKHKAKAKESIYWDPQGELQDLKQYHDGKISGRRIFRGERTTIRYYPFMASIHVMGRFWCGAALYWHDLAITSASCLQLMHNNRFFRENPRVVQLRLGSNHSRIGGEVIDIVEVYFHPSYDPKTLKNNLAVVRLRRHLRFTYHRLPKIIGISHYGHSLPATAEVLVLGWGVTKISQKMSYEPIFLQRKFLPVYPNTFCKEVYGEKFITGSMFCAGTMTTGEGACDHDAGGPAVLAGKLVGVISFGPAVCGFANAPTVFTHVGAYSDWIETVNESMPQYYRGKAPTTTTTESTMNQYLATYRLGHQPVKVAATPEFPVIETSPPTTGPTTTQTTTTLTTTTMTTTTAAAAAMREGYESDGGWSIDVN